MSKAETRGGWVIAAAVLPALIAVAAVVRATSAGVGVSPDSVAYLSSAESLAAGRGFQAIGGGAWYPLTQFPPLFPAVTSLGVYLGVSAASFVRLLQIVLLIVVIVQASWFAWRATNGNRWAPLLTALLLASSVELVSACSMAWSEPLFLVLTLAGLAAFATYLSTGRVGPLAAAAALAAAATLTRYAGTSLLLFGSGAVIVQRHVPIRTRVRHLLIFLAVAIPPLIAWAIRNRLAAGNLTARPLAFHPLPLSAYERGAGTLYRFVQRDIGFFERGSWLQVAFVGAVAGAIILWSLFGRHERTSALHTRIPGWYVVAYLATFTVAGLVQEYMLVLDDRLMLPVLVPGVIVLVAAVVQLRERRIALRAMGILLLAGIALAGFRSSHRWAAKVGAEGVELNSRAFSTSPLIARIRGLPEGAVFAANADDLVFVQTGRLARGLPQRMNPSENALSGDFHERLHAFPSQLGAGALVVYFDAFNHRHFNPTREELAATPGLREVERTPDGAVFEVSAPP